ncbi:MAG: sigma-70 family RNA polymerase sigma factor [Ruminococcus sp.]|nr:sigma-70 family RNA polymerase sigma factor [Ruminococcus sp.]
MTQEDNDKIKLLYEIYEQPMYRIAYAVLKNSGLAEDAVSDAFVRIIGRLNRIKDPYSEKTKAYIVKIIKSTSVNIYRKNKRIINRETVIDDKVLQISDVSQNTEENVIERIENQNRRNLFNKLDNTDRTIINLRYGNDMTWKEVAERTDMTESTVRKRFERAKKKLLSMKGDMSDEKS